MTAGGDAFKPVTSGAPVRISARWWNRVNRLLERFDRLGLGLARFLQALHAERTFFHHTPAADGNIRIQHHAGEIIIHIIAATIFIKVVFEAIRTIPVHPVKVADLVRAVVRAILRTDTAVVGHLVQTF